MPWLPADFVHPTWVAVGEAFHLRPITAADTDLDYPAVMGSRERLWSIYGRAWGSPPVSMTYEEDRDDLARHEAETAAHLSFNHPQPPGPVSPGIVDLRHRAHPVGGRCGHGPSRSIKPPARSRGIGEAVRR